MEAEFYGLVGSIINLKTYQQHCPRFFVRKYRLGSVKQTSR